MRVELAHWHRGLLPAVSRIPDEPALDLANECLWVACQRVELRPKSFLVLACLASRHGQLVNRQTLFDVVWPDVIVTDTVLGVCIHEIRSALGDCARTPRWIETRNRRGYRLVGELSVLQSHDTNS